MIGEKIGEYTGKITSMRVLPANAGGQMKVECSVTETGKLLGIDITDIATYWSINRPDNSSYGEGQGIITTKDGDHVAWTGTGLGKPTGHGMGMAWRASCYYQTTCAKLSRLNGIVGLVQFESDENGNTKSATWEWKDLK